MIQSLHNFAHGTTAQLSCHVQNSDLIRFIFFMIELQIYLQDLDYEPINLCDSSPMHRSSHCVVPALWLAVVSGTGRQHCICFQWGGLSWDVRVFCSRTSLLHHPSFMAKSSRRSCVLYVYSLANKEYDYFEICFVLYNICIIIPSASTKLKGGYTGFTSSVRLSVRPSVDKIMSALYLPQYKGDPLYICTSYQDI